MPRRNGHLKSWSKLSFQLEGSKSPPSQLNDTLNLSDFTNIINDNIIDDDTILSDASLSSITSIDNTLNNQTNNDINSITSFTSDINTNNNNTNNINSNFNDLISLQQDSLQSETLSQEHYNHLLSPSEFINKPKTKQINHLQYNKQQNSQLRKQLQLQWTEKDRTFNQWLKQKPSIQNIMQLNDKLNGNKQQNYNNLEFVWVKLKLNNTHKNHNNKKKNDKNNIYYCWWPGQITLLSNEENTINNNKICVILFTFDYKQKDLKENNFMFEFKRKCIIPFKYLWTQKNLKIFKYVMQYYIEPLRLKDYNL
eukprot:120971_1